MYEDTSGRNWKTMPHNMIHIFASRIQDVYPSQSLPIGAADTMRMWSCCKKIQIFKVLG